MSYGISRGGDEYGNEERLALEILQTMLDELKYSSFKFLDNPNLDSHSNFVRDIN